MVKNIVLSGAGFKCWAYIGTLQALEEYKINGIEQVVGVSAGSIFGLFYILGIKWDFLLDFFMNINFQEELYDVDIDNILSQQSLFAGSKFKSIIREIISRYINPDITFKELKYFSKIKFTVNALNITDSILDYFNYELTPDIKVIDAIMASSRLPVILPPYNINNKLYYDGGLCNNCPVDFVDEVDSMAFDVDCGGDSSTDINLIKLINTIAKIANNSIPKDTYNKHSILEHKFKNEMVNFNQSRDDIFNIYMHGYINSKNIIFKNCIALPAP